MYEMKLPKYFFRCVVVIVACWLSWLLITFLWKHGDKIKLLSVKESDDSEVGVGVMRGRKFINLTIDKDDEEVKGYGENVVELKLRQLSLLTNTDRKPTATQKLVLSPSHTWKRKYVEGEGCVDVNATNGIQDLLCLTKLPYLEKLKNPCWYEADVGHESNPVLRCLPYFHVLGCAKCATTDLFDRLVKHPHILANLGALKKEALWWGWKKYGISNWKSRDIKTFEDYTSLFDNTAEKIEKAMKNNSMLMRKIITGDGSPPDFWDFRAWPLIPQNRRGLGEGKVLTPDLMRHVYRRPRFILLLRNPTDRLYSDYFFSQYGDNPYTFHEDAINSILTLDKCLSNHTERHCFYSGEVFSRLRSRLHYGCYAVFLSEWLHVFDVDQFYIARTEDYSQDVDQHLEDIFHFLGVYSLPQHKLSKIEAAGKKRITKSKAKAAPMLLKTRIILDKFYDNYNKRLANMLKDKKYLWSEWRANFFNQTHRMGV